MSDSSPIRIGISSCLLGEEVRFDGGHKKDSFIAEMLARFVEFIPVCPEVDIGLGIPREAIRLVRRSDGVRLVAPRSGADHTEAMRKYAHRKLGELEALDLSGYILKKDSPSCGMERVRVYGPDGPATKSGVGLFAEALISRWPLLPAEEEGRLNDPALRENFIERVFAYRRLRDFFASRWKVGDLVRFHTAHKLQVLAHDPASFQILGRLVAGASKTPPRELAARYQERFMSALKRIATARRQTNVLQHMMGYFKKTLDARDRKELAGVIEAYYRGLVPLVVPVTLIRHHVARQAVEYLEGQIYLQPHPKELMLRNHV